MKIYIIANGNYNYLSKLDGVVICADGGANNYKDFPDYVIGDMDSIDKELLVEYQLSDKVKVIFDKDKNKTDLELAIELAQTLKPSQIIILGAVGDRLDHTFGNLACLSKFDGKIKIEDEIQEIFLVSDYIEIIGEIGETMSIIPLNEVQGLTYTGLEWNVENKDVEFGWLGVCNKLIQEKATIKLKSGKLLVFKLKHI
ncbi:MAG: thiamine diphosphokinase [Candidatus Magasanikbacteria bacterium]|jgi:thiamine pyrophosphokinase|nr:thiamine diphosphokinase [Candidatus Magasanikbacteria bacterium]MBT4314714.1 thiamine diphosphokinase [Candidatus Magasanikbacteria bacterium]MBT4547491.1 thiamine diphosphokinase [Candidatus Magasanikbacteria bacterium]MBT6819251.1 thiamine diphosphokinase [Candidatus Magasanikbacteria bacterium]